MATYVQVRAWGSSGAYFDLTPYIALEGFKQSRNDIDAPNSGRDTQDGLMHRARVASKKRLDLTFRPLTASEQSAVLQALYPQWLQVQYFDDRLNAMRTMKAYSNNLATTFKIEKNGQILFVGLEAPIVEQ